MILLLLLVTPVIVKAQQTDELKKEINKIKKSSLYLYAETTMPDKEEALATAIDMLELEAQKWIAEKKKKNEMNADLVLTNIAQRYNRVELPRGNMYRAFAYVRKSDIFTTQNTLVTEVVTLDEGEGNIHSTSEEMTIQPVDLPDAIRQLLTLRNYEEVPACLEKLQQEGKITDYKRYASLINPDAYVLIIYNRQSEVEAILGEGPDRINMRTSQPDRVANYKGRGAIGVKISK